MADQADNPGAGPGGLDGLFPAGAVSILSQAAPVDAALLPAELAAARAYSPQRLREFIHGRACARRALVMLGAGAAPVTVGANREPLWPPGVVGSISHAGAAAAAVVAWQSTLLALGLDLEEDLPLEPELAGRICRPEERSALLAPSAEPGLVARRVFSMKEAAYKALWPLINRFLDFHDLEIRPGPQADAFSVVSRSDHCPGDLAARLVGRWTRHGTLLACGVAIRP